MNVLRAQGDLKVKDTKVIRAECVQQGEEYFTISKLCLAPCDYLFFFCW